MKLCLPLYTNAVTQIHVSIHVHKVWEYIDLIFMPLTVYNNSAVTNLAVGVGKYLYSQYMYTVVPCIIRVLEFGEKLTFLHLGNVFKI